MVPAALRVTLRSPWGPTDNSKFDDSAYDINHLVHFNGWDVLLLPSNSPAWQIPPLS